MEKVIASVNTAVWGAPALFLLLGVGIYLSWRLDFPQITFFTEAWKHFFSQLLPGKRGDSSFRAVCTALAATVGTGNLVGVAGAICLGGPGAVFWMWICGFLGMATKYAEAVLAVRYRVKTPEGPIGGPMYMITGALPGKFHFLAYLYALFGVMASFGVGNMTQIHAAENGIREALSAFGWQMDEGAKWMLTLAFAAIIGTLLCGGARRIYGAAEKLVPFGAAGYLLLCAGVLLWNWRRIPDAFAQIFQGAFCPRSVTGGLIGAAFQTLRIGCSRGTFTNEAGMGTAAMAHGAAEVTHPVRQGMMGIMEVFLDTIVICTLTALVILVSGVPVPYGSDAGGQLTTLAFSAVYGRAAAVFLAAVLTLFAIATVMGWGLYGARCAGFLFGRQVWRYFAAAQMLAVVLGSFLDTPTLWQLAETVNGLMAIPNLITLAVLTPEVRRLTKEYKKTGSFGAGGGNYANFHQRKPL